jgi:hypothetical protein
MSYYRTKRVDNVLVDLSPSIVGGWVWRQVSLRRSRGVMPGAEVRDSGAPAGVKFSTHYPVPLSKTHTRAFCYAATPLGRPWRN